jgi:multidrug transporter EmrE-like cation transporter
VALGLSTHGLLILLGSVVLLILGLCHNIRPLYFFHLIDIWPIRRWSSVHRTEVLALATCYVFLSFAVSHWLGLAYGVWRGKAPITAAVLRRAAWLQKLGVTGLLGEKPILYEILSANVAEDGTEYTVFLELEMKNQLGFYAGQLSQFAIVRDEEPHKPIYLIDASYRRTLADDYEPLQGDGVLLDLADAAQVFVKQVEP